MDGDSGLIQSGTARPTLLVVDGDDASRAVLERDLETD